MMIKVILLYLTTCLLAFIAGLRGRKFDAKAFFIKFERLADLKRRGFECEDDELMMIRQLDLTTHIVKEKYDEWSESDGTKVGLRNVIEFQSHIGPPKGGVDVNDHVARKEIRAKIDDNLLEMLEQG